MSPNRSDAQCVLNANMRPEWIIPSAGLFIGLSALLFRDYVADRRQRGLSFLPFKIPLLRIGIIVLIGAIVAGLVLPVIRPRSGGHSRRNMSASNLNQIGKALMMYSDDPTQTGMFPANSMWELYPRYLADYRTLYKPREAPKTCPANPGASDGGYVYIPGYGMNDSPDTIVVYERTPTNGGRNVLFLAGNVEWLENAEFVRRIQIQDNRKNPAGE